MNDDIPDITNPELREARDQLANEVLNLRVALASAFPLTRALTRLPDFVGVGFGHFDYTDRSDFIILAKDYEYGGHTDEVWEDPEFVIECASITDLMRIARGAQDLIRELKETYNPNKILYEVRTCTNLVKDILNKRPELKS